MSLVRPIDGIVSTARITTNPIYASRPVSSGEKNISHKVLMPRNTHAKETPADPLAIRLRFRIISHTIASAAARPATPEKSHISIVTE